MNRFAVIVPAAGQSTRFGGGRNKLLEPLRGIPVLRRTAEAFLQRADVACVVVATSAENEARAAMKDAPPALAGRLRFCRGGACRAESVRRALREVGEEIAWVAVHDAARPLVSQDLIDRTFAAAVEHGAAVPALPVSLTIKEANGPLPAKVQRTVPRQALWAMQTPQAMRRDALLAAFNTCPLPLEQVTDDVQLLELTGCEVWLVPGDERNLKITTAQDLLVAAMLLEHDPPA